MGFRGLRGSRFRGYGFGVSPFWVSGSVFRVLGFSGSMFLGSEFRVWGSRFSRCGVSGFVVSQSWVRGFGLGEGVRGSGFSSFGLGVLRFAVLNFEVGVSQLGV